VKQRSEIKRRNPTQQRAGTTVDTIFEATARIVEEGDRNHLTTNHIAEKAGYSIGTLYGYFPNKQSLLRAMARREMRRQEERLVAALKAVTHEQDASEIVRIVILAALRPFEHRSRLRLGLMQLLLKDDDVRAAIQSVEDHIFNVFLEALASHRKRPCELSASTRFVLVTAVSSTVQSAVLHQPDLLETKAFEDALVAMTVAIIDAPSTENMQR
jgi:AcrR family transcriptional regulator